MHDQGAASRGLEFNSLLHANFAAVPQSIPVIALAFVYQVIVVLTEFFSGC
jgi:tyrosine-specific transport protein